MLGARCPKCGGNLYIETDLAAGMFLRKCLQCGLIESYYWLERTTKSLIRLPVERDQPVSSDMW
jgi:predicted nucleic-acid-binding Zn-ribbon protein